MIGRNYLGAGQDICLIGRESARNQGRTGNRHDREPLSVLWRSLNFCRIAAY
jgi:hypothetical protein